MIPYYLFLLLTPFQEHPKLGGVLFSLVFVPITPIKIVGLVTVTSAFLAAVPRGNAKRLPTAIPTLYTLFTIVPVGLVMLRELPFPKAPVSQLISYGFLLIATRRLVSTPERMRNVVRVLVFSETFGSLWLYKQHYILHLLNPNGPSSDSNYEALSIVMTIPLALYLVRYDTSVTWRRIAAACAPILAFAVVVSQSRGGLLALGILMLLGWLRARRKVLVVLLTVVALAMTTAIAPSATWQRLQQIQITGKPRTGAELSTRTRIELWRGGIHIIESHPLLGIGLDQFKSQVGFYNPKLIPLARRTFIAHNTYIQVWAEEGVAMLAVFLSMIWLSLSNYRFAESCDRQSGEGLGQLATAMRLGLIAYLVAAFFLSADLVKTLWMFVFLSQNLLEIVSENLKPAAKVVRMKRPEQTRQVVSVGNATA
jgi:O-antigen ligase